MTGPFPKAWPGRCTAGSVKDAGGSAELSGAMQEITLGGLGAKGACWEARQRARPKCAPRGARGRGGCDKSA